MKKIIAILVIGILSLPLFAELSTEEILMEAQKVSFKHEGNSRFVVSDSLDHYIIYKDDIGQFRVEGVFKGHLIKGKKVANMLEGYEHYSDTYFAVLESGENKIYYKDEISDLYEVRVEDTPVIESQEAPEETVEEEDIPVAKVSNPEEEKDEGGGGKSGGISLGTIFTILIIYWLFFKD